MLGKIVFFLIFLGFIVGVFRQIGIYFRTNRRLALRQKELRELEEKNRALKVRLEEVQSPKFLDEQARKLLGAGDNRGIPVGLPAVGSEEEKLTPEVEESILPNYLRWWKLFVH